MTKQERLEKAIARAAELKRYENELRIQGYRFIAGVDEVGRGPLAGPVVTACVVLPEDFAVLGVDDSKKLTEKKREALYDEILSHCICYGIGSRPAEVIDEVNILEATKLAMISAIDEADMMLREKQGKSIDFVIFDAMRIPAVDKPQMSLIKGDANSVSVAAASIVAKVWRDRLMKRYEEEYPGYGFASNKGYGTEAHYAGLKTLGMTPIHRRSFLKNLSEH